MCCDISVCNLICEVLTFLLMRHCFSLRPFCPCIVSLQLHAEKTMELQQKLLIEWKMFAFFPQTVFVSSVVLCFAPTLFFLSGCIWKVIYLWPVPPSLIKTTLTAKLFQLCERSSSEFLLCSFSFYSSSHIWQFVLLNGRTVQTGWLPNKEE